MDSFLIAAANPANLILERGVRQYQFWEHCQRYHGKQGGSHYSQFCLDRLGQEPWASSYQKAIGEHHGELFGIAKKFVSDYTAIYLYTGLPPEQKARLL